MTFVRSGEAVADQSDDNEFPSTVAEELDRCYCPCLSAVLTQADDRSNVNTQLQ